MRGQIPNRQNARIEHDSLEKLVVGAANDHSGLYKKFVDNPEFPLAVAPNVQFDIRRVGPGCSKAAQ
jgi:hypothetical protein